LKSPQRRQLQNKLSGQLSGYSRDIEESYLGARCALQEERRDKFVQFASSLRGVIDQLAKFNGSEGCKDKQNRSKGVKGKYRSQCLQETFELVGDENYLPFFEKLVVSYRRLSGVIHHDQKMSEIEAHRVLSCVEDALDKVINRPFEIKERIEEMFKERGEPRQLHETARVFLRLEEDISRVGYKSHDRVFEGAKKYKPQESPMDEDYADVFGAYVRDHALECSERAAELGSAHPRIQYELFIGLRDAVQADERIEWESVMPLIKCVIERCSKTQDRAGSDESALEAGSSELPPLALFWLIEEGLKKDLPDFGLRDEMRSVVESLVEIGTADVEHSDYPDKTSALTMSLNSFSGTSFHIIYQYAAWCHRHDKEQTLVPEAKAVFDSYLDKKIPHTVSRHAVLGVFLPGLHYLDQEWAKLMLPKMRHSPKTKIAFWDGYVSGRQMYSHMFGDLWEWYDEFVNEDSVQNPELARIHESTIGHVMLAYFYDLPNSDGIVEKFLERQYGEAIERCVQQTSFVLIGKVDDPKFNKAKLVGLWKHRAFKESNLSMWFINTPLDKETAVALYRDHVKQYTGKINMSYDPVYKLAEYAEDCPSEVAECLEVLIDRYAHGDVPDKVREILESLLKSKDPHIKATYRKIVEKAVQERPDWSDLLQRD